MTSAYWNRAAANSGIMFPMNEPLPPSKRPLWAKLVIGVYALLAGTILLGPLGLAFVDGSPGPIFSAIFFCALLFLCGASLFLIPVPKGGRERVLTRRSIWVSIVGSSLLAALVGFGFTIAFDEFIESRLSNSFSGLPIAFGVLAVWLGWLVLFGGIALSRGPAGIGHRLWQALLAGSVAELLVAVPMHLAVRQRAYCCAGMMTGLGIALGVVVLVTALGPAVFVLCYRRYQQVYSERRDR